jgi:hypothetical protein
LDSEFVKIFSEKTLTLEEQQRIDAAVAKTGKYLELNKDILLDLAEKT